jgi:hypothetical protein
MPYRRFDGHQHITEVWGESRSARAAVDRLKAAVADHESDEDPAPMTVDAARARLQAYLHELPDEWG